MTGELSNPRCEKCYRGVGLPIAACPDRSAGSCPYRVWQNRSRWKEGIYFLACAAIWNTMIFFLVLEVITGEMSWFGRVGLALFATPFVLVGLGLPCAGFYFLFRRRVTWHNSSSGTMWQQEWVFRVQCWRRVVARQEVVALEGELPQDLLSTPSVAALAPQPSQAGRKPKDKDLAANVAETALLGLLSRGMLEVHRANFFTTSGNRGDGYVDCPSSMGEMLRYTSTQNHVAYLIAASAAASRSIVEGTLEGRILGLMRDWPTSPQAQDWPLPPTIYLLVQAIFEKDHNNPDRWLLDLVREDAVARGLLTRQKGGRMRRSLYKPEPSLAHGLLAEGEAMREWRTEVAWQQPEFASALEKEIRSAIRSRETSGD